MEEEQDKQLVFDGHQGRVSADGVNWPTNSVVARPATRQSCLDSSVTDSSSLRPFSYGHCNPVRRNHSTTPAVSRLLGICLPSAIAFLIWAIVVDSSLREFGAVPFFHVVPPVIECQPGGINSDTSAAISRIGRVFGTGTSFNHVVPDFVLTCTRHPMCSIGIGATLFVEASATTGLVLDKIALVRNSLITAFAFAQPFSVSATAWLGLFKDCKSAIHFTSKVQGVSAYVLQTSATFGVPIQEMPLVDNGYVATFAATLPSLSFTNLPYLSGHCKFSESFPNQICLVDSIGVRYHSVRHACVPIQPSVLEQPRGPRTQTAVRISTTRRPHLSRGFC